MVLLFACRDQMPQPDEYRELIAALMEKLKEMGIYVTHVHGHPDFLQPFWINLPNECALPDVIAEDMIRGLFVLGDVKTADAWNTEGARRKIEILQSKAHRVYVMVPDSAIHHAKKEQLRNHWRNVFYLSPSSVE